MAITLNNQFATSVFYNAVDSSRQLAGSGFIPSSSSTPLNLAGQAPWGVSLFVGSNTDKGLLGTVNVSDGQTISLAISIGSN